MQQQLSLRYNGPSVEDGRMDVYAASANMIAFSEFVVEAAKSTFGGQIEARAEVAGFGRGSFITDLVFNVAGPTLTLLAAVSPDHLLKVINEAVALWKHLEGAPPAHVEHKEKQQSVSVVNNNGKILQVQTETLNLVFGEKAAEAVQRFIREPLMTPGIDGVEIGSGGRVIADIAPNEAPYFVPVTPAEKVADATFRMALVIEAPVFKEGNKWRFSDGTSSFYAAIEDKDFLARVDAGERFGKGDILVADVRFVQERSGQRITAERIVVKVQEHRVAQEQERLPF